MRGYYNKFALEHIELFTKKKNEVGGRFPFHVSVKIVNVDSIWLDNMVNIIEGNPTIMYSYLDSSNTQNLAAYILLSCILDIDMPKDGNEEVVLYLL